MERIYTDLECEIYSAIMVSQLTIDTLDNGIKIVNMGNYDSVGTGSDISCHGSISWNLYGIKIDNKYYYVELGEDEDDKQVFVIEDVTNSYGLIQEYIYDNFNDEYEDWFEI